ncbi:hypothetical protein [Acinetobacter junii]|uniref:hypothetical protein n=1 Tax=Acinetobacter junii TaxID=40215 RepID=UPI003A87B276
MHQPEYRRQCSQLHKGIWVQILRIQVVQLTKNNVNDSLVLGNLLDQIPQKDQIY